MNGNINGKDMGFSFNHMSIPVEFIHRESKDRGNRGDGLDRSARDPKC